MKYTDLVMLDIKHIEDAAHKELTGKGNENILGFAKYLEEKNIDYWNYDCSSFSVTFNLYDYPL